MEFEIKCSVCEVGFFFLGDNGLCFKCRGKAQPLGNLRLTHIVEELLVKIKKLEERVRYLESQDQTLSLKRSSDFLFYSVSRPKFSFGHHF